MEKTSGWSPIDLSGIIHFHSFLFFWLLLLVLWCLQCCSWANLMSPHPHHSDFPTSKMWLLFLLSSEMAPRVVPKQPVWRKPRLSHQQGICVSLFVISLSDERDQTVSCLFSLECRASGIWVCIAVEEHNNPQTCWSQVHLCVKKNVSLLGNVFLALIKRCGRHHTAPQIAKESKDSSTLWSLGKAARSSNVIPNLSYLYKFTSEEVGAWRESECPWSLP